MNDIQNAYAPTLDIQDIQLAKDLILQLISSHHASLKEEKKLIQQTTLIDARMEAIRGFIDELFTSTINHPVDAKTLDYIESKIKTKTTPKIHFSTDENDLQI